MKGSLIVFDEFDGRKAAAHLVDGRLADLLIDPSDGMPPAPGAILRAVCDRPMKGQGGMFLSLPGGQKGFLRQAKGMSPGQVLLVQVAGIGMGSKATPVNTRLLFKSRYAIVTPNAPGLNIARSIRDEEERERLQELAHDGMAGAPEGFGLILRSACAGADEAEIADDIAEMRQMGEAVMADSEGGPELLLDAPDAHLLAWRDWPAPDELSREGFEALGVWDAVEALKSAHVGLPAGASMLVEPTSALIAVDVNTGNDSSLAAGLKANLAMARELPRQLRLRGLAGQVTLDVAPMPKKERRVFEDALRKSFRVDGADVALAGWTPLGLYELQLKRERWPLKELLP